MSFIKRLQGMSKSQQREAIEELLNKSSGKIEDSEAYTSRQADTNTTAMHVDEVQLKTFVIGTSAVTGTARYTASGDQIEEMADAGVELQGEMEFNIDDHETVELDGVTANIVYGDGDEEEEIVDEDS